MTQTVRRANGATLETTRCPIRIDGARLTSPRRICRPIALLVSVPGPGCTMRFMQSKSPRNADEPVTGPLFERRCGPV